MLLHASAITAILMKKRSCASLLSRIDSAASRNQRFAISPYSYSHCVVEISENTHSQTSKVIPILNGFLKELRVSKTIITPENVQNGLTIFDLNSDKTTKLSINDFTDIAIAKSMRIELLYDGALFDGLTS